MTERKIDFMKTDLFHIGKFVIHGYGLMIGIGFVLALLVGEYRAKKMGMKEEALIDIAIIAGVSGFLGACSNRRRYSDISYDYGSMASLWKADVDADRRSGDLSTAFGKCQSKG